MGDSVMELYYGEVLGTDVYTKALEVSPRDIFLD